MNRVANTYWIDPRLSAQQPTTRAFDSFTSSHQVPSETLTGTRAEVRRRGNILPSWVFFAVIILATFALCITVTMRTHAEMRVAEQHYQHINNEVQALRSSNARLGHDLQRLRTDPQLIESTARLRLNMVRPDEIVVPVK